MDKAPIACLSEINTSNCGLQTLLLSFKLYCRIDCCPLFASNTAPHLNCPLAKERNWQRVPCQLPEQYWIKTLRLVVVVVHGRNILLYIVCDFQWCCVIKICQFQIKNASRPLLIARIPRDLFLP